MDPFTIAFLASSAVSAVGGLMGAASQAASAEANAFNVETQKELNDAAAMQRANDRYEQFKLAESANRALLGGAMGRDLGEDRSVAAFLKRNRESAFRDMDRMEMQREMESLNFDIQAASERRRAQDIMMSGVVNAFSSAATTMMRYDAIRMPTQATPLAPASSPRPMMRPR